MGIKDWFYTEEKEKPEKKEERKEPKPEEVSKPKEKINKYLAETSAVVGAISGLFIAGIIGFLIYGSWWGLLFWGDYGLIGGAVIGLCIASSINSKNKDEINKKEIKKKINSYLLSIVLIYLLVKYIIPFLT